MFERPEQIAEAWRQVGAWLEADVAWIPQPTERHRDVLGTLPTDAHPGALAIEHGLLLCSTDGDFSRFPDLRWQNPLGA